MKITLNRQSRMFLIHKLANALERNTNWNAYVEYYWKGDDGLRNARFDLVLFDNDLNIKYVIEAKHRKNLDAGVIKMDEKWLTFFKNKQLERYYEVLSKNDIPLIVVNLDEKKEATILSDILEQL